MNNMSQRGKFIVFYGINNLGKTTQARKIVERLNQEGLKTEYLKYPIYDLKPSGEILNNYLREGNTYNLNSREAQLIYTLNRAQYEENLLRLLEQNRNVVAEDYTGTGIAWGIGRDIHSEFLEKLNSSLFKEDMAILLDGERFESAIEKNHRNETNEALTNKVRNIHLDLAKKYNWKIINANKTIDEVHENIYKEIKKILN